MIDPNNIIDFNRTDEELEELILFLIFVAGKKASTIVKQLESFLNCETTVRPFDLIRIRACEGLLRHHLEKNRLGQYTKLERALTELVGSGINLRTCTKEDLMAIHGIGRKSASCFLAWTRKGERVAMLDTHILKWIRHAQHNLGWLDEKHPLKYFHSYLKDVTIPKSTPSSKKLYDTLETFYLDYCDKMGLDPTAYDLHIWRMYSNKHII